MTLNMYRITLSGKKLAQAQLNTYVYKGNKWNSTKGNTYYNYVIATMQVAPTADYYVDNFTGRIKSQHANTSIVEAVYLDDNCSSQSYSLSAGGNIGSDGKCMALYNKTCSYSYSTTAMDITEKFSHQGDSCGYVDWYVNPCKDTKGQSRYIAPAVVTRAANTCTNMKTAIRDIKLHGLLNWELAGEALSATVSFK